MAGGHLEIDAAKDWARILVSEEDVLEPDRALAHDQRLCARLVLYLGLLPEQCEHGLDVDERLFDLAIDHAHDVERLIELDETPRSPSQNRQRTALPVATSRAETIIASTLCPR